MPVYLLALLVFSAFLPVCGAGLEATVKSTIPQLIPYPSSFEDARETYQNVGQRISEVLPESKSVKYEVLVSFPTSDCGEYHAEDKNYGAGVVNFTDYSGVNVFVGKYNRTKVEDKTNDFNKAWDVIQSEARNAMDMIFDPLGGGNFNDLCFRILDVDKWTSGKLISAHFRALVAIRCARRFVWYELGWHFYKAYWTSSEYAFHYNDRRDDWGNSCGTLVFFP